MDSDDRPTLPEILFVLGGAPIFMALAPFALIGRELLPIRRNPVAWDQKIFRRFGESWRQFKIGFAEGASLTRR